MLDANRFGSRLYGGYLQSLVPLASQQWQQMNNCGRGIYGALGGRGVEDFTHSSSVSWCPRQRYPGDEQTAAQQSQILCSGGVGR
jgi:hypothetical protein